MTSSESHERAVSQRWQSRYGNCCQTPPGTLFVSFGVHLAAAPLIVGSLGFLGIGIRPPTAEWGQMITQNAPAMLGSPSTVMGPAFVLVGMVVGLNMFVDGLARVLGRSKDLLARGA